MSSSINNQPLSTLNIFSLKGIQMKTFHTTWLMFFVCFFGWFGLAPLMPTIRGDLHLTKSQIGNLVIISVSSTIIARLLIGKLCDTWGPRKTAVRLLLVGSLPVFLVGLSKDYTTFLLFRAAIGVIGASFVITQFHTSMMFANNIKGTANAVAGGWGNLGGGVTNMVMPLIFALAGIALSWLYYIKMPDLPARTVAAFPRIHQFFFNKWYFDELYDVLFVRPTLWLGRLLWKGGDGWLIDGFGPDGVSARVLDVTRNVVRLQTGYLYHYAFAMLIGVAALITWFIVRFGGAG